MADDLKKATLKGTIWSSIERFSVQGIQFVVMILMARVLVPADYGLVGMLTIFTAISDSLVDSGFSQGLIRKQDRTETDNSTVFFFNIGAGLCLYLLLYFSAPLIADFYNEPKLVVLTRVICLSIVINSFIAVQRALFTVNIDFRTQAKATFSGAVLSGAIGITMAYTGFGVWAIVAQQLTNLSVVAIMMWFLSKWRPSLTFSGKSFRTLFSFGSKIALSGIIDCIYRNIYLIVIGKIFRASDLGYYTRAQQFANFPSSNVSGIVQRVTFPVLCKIQDDDERLSDVYRKLLRISAFIVFPVMMLLAGVAVPFVNVILNPKWEFAGVLLQILCFSMMWYPIHAINLNLLQVKGRSDLFLKLEIYKKLIGVTVLVATIPLGLKAMCYGAIVTSLLALVINTHYTGKLIGVGFIRQICDLTPSLIYSISTFAVTLAVSWLFKAPLWSLLAGACVGNIYFAAVTHYTRSKDLHEVFSILKMKKGKKSTSEL